MSMVIDIHKVKGVRPHYDLYIGRAQMRTHALHEEFPKDSKWANPFSIEKYGAKALELYENYIRKRISLDPKMFNLNELEGLRLGCWCATTRTLTPLKCHGQILIKLLKIKKEVEARGEVWNPMVG